MRRELIIAAAAARDQARSWGSLAGTGVFLIFILFVFSELWETIASEQSWDISPTLMLWYLAFTEVVVMSVPRISFAIEQDLRADRVTNMLLRPLGYFRQKFAEFCGQALVRFCFILTIGFLSATAYTGEIPLTPLLLVSIPIALALGTFLALLHLFAIGVTAVWLGESTPLTWLYQKLQFVLGGLMIPLHFYPEWLAQVSFDSPFAAMLYGPASLLFESSIAQLVELLMTQLIWIAVSVAVVCIAGKLAVRRLTLTGGAV